MKFGIGQSVARTEDPVLLTGRGAYTDDVQIDGAAHGVVVRAPVAHAKIVSIDLTAARAVPGVLAVLTGDDIKADSVGDLACLTDLKNVDGSDQGRTPWPLLATDRVRYVGNPVAFVVAETLAAARDGADALDIDYEELPVVTDTLGAASLEAPQVWAHLPGNQVFDYAEGDLAATDAAFASAAHVTKVEIVNNRIVSNAMEPRAAIAEVDPGSGRFTLRVPSQGPFFVFNQLTSMLDIPPEDLRVITGHVGGGFGTKAFLYPEAALTLWAAKRLGRTVRWTGERSEIFLSDAHGRDNVTHAEMAMVADGRFLGLRATTYAAMGAYLSNFGPMIPTVAAVAMYTGLYKIPAVHVGVKGIVTNTVPVDAYRGAGRPEAAYLIERLVDAAARDLGLTPDELRRRNLPNAAEMPHQMGLGPVIDSGDFPGLMEAAMDRADWAGFAARKAESAASGQVRGIGMATYVERCASGGGTPARVIVQDDGIALLSGTQDSGQGHATAFQQILSEKFGVDVERISLAQGDTDTTPPGFTGGSKSIPVGGVSVVKAADKVIEKGREIAGRILETASADIEFGDGAFRVTGTDRSVDLFAVARAAKDPAIVGPEAAAELEAEHDHVPDGATFPNGCHICEVEIDPATGVVTLQRYTVIDDFGIAMNPALLLGQVHGGIAQGLGQAMSEHTVYDPESGQLLAATFMDYQMPRAADFVDFDITFRHTRCATNPLGIKGAGEAGAIGAPPAVMNAIIDAMHSHNGTTAFDMPATPQRVWSAMNGA